MQRYKRPLKKSVYVNCVFFFVVISIVLSILTYTRYKNALYKSYEKRMTDILVYVSSHVDVDDLSECVANRTDSPKSIELKAFMDDMLESFDIHYFYIVTSLNTNETDNIMDVITAQTEWDKLYDDEGYYLGYVFHDEYNAEMAKLHMDAMNGDDIVFFEDFTAWGYDYTGLMPLVDSNGNHFAVIGVDIDVQEIRNTITDYTIINITVMLLSMGVFIIVFTYWLNKNITDPISKLEKSVHNLAQKSHEQKDPEQLRFIDPQIHTGNEVEGLANAINQMADDMHEYVLSIVEAEAKVSDLKTQVNYMDMLAYQDSLTRVKNKAWYDKTKERVDEDIENGHAEFAIVMIDLNCLKSINDNYGHERGNEYIFGSCHQICVTYQHSPVFRVGGDEFVVLLEKNDYNNREALLGLLMAAFEESANDESKQPWERYSAAIGMAEFDPGQDIGMDDVFKRADKLMYDNKIKMKAARK